MEMYSLIHAGSTPGERNEKKPCVFLDRDGVIIRNMNYLKDPEQIYFLPEVFAGLRRMRSMGFRLVMISNQSGVGRGYFTGGELMAVHDRMTEMLAEEDLFLDACYYCPHAPDEHCGCRKPATGMLEQACRTFSVDRDHSWMIGDSECDMKLAENFAIRGILIHESGAVSPAGQFAVCADLAEAAELISKNMASSAIC